MQCLREADFDSLVAANQQINAEALLRVVAFVPVVDGDFITDYPSELLSKGRLNGVNQFV